MTKMYITKRELQELEWDFRRGWQTLLAVFIIAHQLQAKVSINLEAPPREIREALLEIVPAEVEGTISGIGLPLKVLVIDSDSTARSSLASALSQADFEMVTAADCVEAAAKLKQRQPHLIILTDGLPGIEELCFQIRESFNAPIIMLGNQPGEQAWERASLLGADAYLTKSIGKLELVARAKAILRRYRK